MKPVEKMAARLLKRHGLAPPYDLENLVSTYGDLQYTLFPFEADGITIGIGGESKPQVLINSNAVSTRMKFTLAHELGHIIIPWHTGTIVSHIEDHDSDFEYQEMESEANQFAAELLIPRAWLLGLQNDFSSLEDLITHVLEATGASRDAALIKIFNTLQHPVICGQIDQNGTVIRQYRSRSAPTGAALIGRNVRFEEIFTTNIVEEEFELGDRSYYSWKFVSGQIEETDHRPWRDVLNQILEETDSKELLSRVNAVLAAKYGSNRDKTESELCALALQTYDGRGDFDKVIAHPLFPQYVVKRIKELVARNNAKS